MLSSLYFSNQWTVFQLGNAIAVYIQQLGQLNYNAFYYYLLKYVITVTRYKHSGSL